jgi:type IX secretion system PorP/SprF family membrane protein
MMKMRFAILFLLIVCAALLQAQQLPMQRPGLNQGLLWNPALTAPGRYWEAGAFFQQQWIGFPGAPSTLMAYAQYPWQKQGMSTGMVLYLDEVGPLVHSGVQFSYAYRLRPGISGDDLLSLGIQARAAQWRFDPSRVVARDEGDALLQGDRSSAWSLSPGFGLFYISHHTMDFDVDCWYVGLSVDQLAGLNLQGKESFLPGRQPHFRGMIGYRFIDYNRMWEPVIYADLDRLAGSRFGANLRFEQDRSYWGLLGLEYQGLLRMGGGYVLRTGSNTGRDLLIGAELEYNPTTTGRAQGLSYFFTLAWRGYMVLRQSQGNI